MFLGLGCLGIIVAMIGSLVVGTFLWKYNIDTWLLYAGKPTQVAWYTCTIISVIPHLGYLSIPVALITYISMLFL